MEGHARHRVRAGPYEPSGNFLSHILPCRRSVAARRRDRNTKIVRVRGCFRGGHSPSGAATSQSNTRRAAQRSSNDACQSRSQLLGALPSTAEFCLRTWGSILRPYRATNYEHVSEPPPLHLSSEGKDSYCCTVVQQRVGSQARKEARWHNSQSIYMYSRNGRYFGIFSQLFRRTPYAGSTAVSPENSGNTHTRKPQRRQTDL